MKKYFTYLLIALFILPTISFAEVSEILFVTEEQSIKTGTPSSVITVKFQNSSGEVGSMGETSDLFLESSSGTGEFSSNAENWESIEKLTVNSNWTSRSFYYRDSSEGVFTISARLASRSESGREFNTTQSITVSTEGAPTNSGEVLGASINSGSLSSGGQSASSVSITSSDSGKLEISAGSDRLTSPGSPIIFQAIIKKNTTQGKPSFSWSFGDGYVGEGSRVSHVYKYPGDYVVVLSAKAGEVYSISRVKVKVAESNFSISETEEYIEISNNSSSEINLFQWKLTSRGRGFIFQPDTIVLPKSKLRIDRALLSMKGEKEETTLQNSEKQTVVALEGPLSRDLASQVKDLETQAYSLVATAVQNRLVTEKSAPVVSSPLPVVATEEVVWQEGIIDEEAIVQEGDVIYESAKSESIFSKLTNFVKSVFSR